MRDLVRIWPTQNLQSKTTRSSYCETVLIISNISTRMHLRYVPCQLRCSLPGLLGCYSIWYQSLLRFLNAGWSIHSTTQTSSGVIQFIDIRSISNFSLQETNKSWYSIFQQSELTPYWCIEPELIHWVWIHRTVSQLMHSVLNHNGNHRAMSNASISISLDQFGAPLKLPYAPAKIFNHDAVSANAQTQSIPVWLSVTKIVHGLERWIIRWCDMRWETEIGWTDHCHGMVQLSPSRNCFHKAVLFCFFFHSLDRSIVHARWEHISLKICLAVLQPMRWNLFPWLPKHVSLCDHRDHQYHPIRVCAIVCLHQLSTKHRVE